MKKTLVTLLMICCSTVAYATSVSVMITPPQIAAANSTATTPTDVSAILTVVYGEYPQVYGKGEVNFATNALSASFQARGIYSNTATIEKNLLTNDTGDPNNDPSSPTPVPEPNALVLVGIGLAGLGLALRPRR